VRTLTTLSLAAALMLGASSAHADMKELARWGVWAAYSGTDDENKPVCSIVVNGDVRSLHIKWQPGHGLFIHARKETWDVPANFPMPMIMQFDNDAPLKGTASRHAGIKHGKTIQYTIGYNDTAKRFMERFASSYRMRVTFPGGSERDWNMSMEGSRVIANHFARCVVDLGHRHAGQLHNSQPHNSQPHNKPKAMQPTQPFRKDMTPLPRTRPGITEDI
jgi:hypothetical protein